jgi:hypothetical protein
MEEVLLGRHRDDDQQSQYRQKKLAQQYNLFQSASRYAFFHRLQYFHYDVQMFTGLHRFILHVHIAIQMNTGLIIKPYASGYSWTLL